MMLMMTFTRAVCVCEHALLKVLRREAGLVCCVEYGTRMQAYFGVAGFWRVGGQEQATGESTSSSNSARVSNFDTRIQVFKSD